MDKSRFGARSTGRLVEVSTGKRDWAFVPDPLPRQWPGPGKLWPLLADARENLARLDGIGQALPDPALLLRPLQNREALRSSSLEGTYASPEELLLFELAEHPKDDLAATDRISDWREVHNYASAVRLGTSLLEKLPLSLRLIRAMHEELLSGVRGKDRSPGQFRTSQVHIGTDRRYVPPPANEMPACLDAFEKFLNDAEEIPPLIRAFIAHYQFEAIHPFLDGNGRVGRALLSLCAYQWCGLSAPWLYVSPFFDRHKDEYIEALFGVSTDGAWDRWLELCLRATVDVCKDAIARCTRLVELNKEYHAKADTKSVRMHAIVARLFTNPIIRITDVARHVNVTYPTAKDDIEKLFELGLLAELPGTYPKAFYAREIFAAAYSEDFPS